MPCFRATPRVRIVLLTSLSAVLFAACGDSGGHDATLPNVRKFLGTYDASVTEGPTAMNANAVGVVQRRPDGGAHIHMDINNFDAIDLDATSAADGSLTLNGFHIEGVDSSVPIAGTATIEVCDRERRISGTTEDTLGERLSFVMVSPTSGTPTSLVGSYVFSFDPSPSACDCSSAAILALSVKADGRSTLGPGTDANVSSAVVGTFARGTCAVSPMGRLRCMGTYHPEGTQGGDVSESIVWQGSLPSASSPGIGEFLRGSPPSLFLTGQWSATRAP